MTVVRKLGLLVIELVLNKCTRFTRRESETNPDLLKANTPRSLSNFLPSPFLSWTRVWLRSDLKRQLPA